VSNEAQDVSSRADRLERSNTYGTAVMQDDWGRAAPQIAGIGFAFFAGGAAVLIVLALNGIELDRHVPAPWAWNSAWSLVCLGGAMIWALFAAVHLLIFRVRHLQKEMSMRRLDALKADVDNTLKELRTES